MRRAGQVSRVVAKRRISKSTLMSQTMTTEQLLAMPEDGVDRELIRGQLKETPVTKRNRFHSLAVARVTRLLDEWLDSGSIPGGEVHSGDVGTILRRDPDTTVGIDVALFSADVVASQTGRTTLIEGVPLMAVHILSPADTVEDVRDKVLEYLAAGVSMVWIVDPYFQTVQVHRAAVPPETFNRDHHVSGSNILPGLTIAVAEIFQRASGN